MQGSVCSALSVEDVSFRAMDEDWLSAIEVIKLVFEFY